MTDTHDEIKKVVKEYCEDLVTYGMKKSYAEGREQILNYFIHECLQDKFRIIPKTDDPAKHVEIYFKKDNGLDIEVSEKFALKLKWRDK